MACEIGAFDIVEYLLKNKHNPNLKNHAKETPLYPAIKSGQTAIVQLLLEHEADPEVHNRFGETPIDFAIVQGQVDIQQIIETHISGSLYKQQVKKNPLRHAVLIEDLDLLMKFKYDGLKDHKDIFSMSAYDYAHKENLKAFKEVLEVE
jgi:ankyrin repeat protein